MHFYYYLFGSIVILATVLCLTSLKEGFEQEYTLKMGFIPSWTHPMTPPPGDAEVFDELMARFIAMSPLGQRPPHPSQLSASQRAMPPPPPIPTIKPVLRYIAPPTTMPPATTTAAPRAGTGNVVNVADLPFDVPTASNGGDVGLLETTDNKFLARALAEHNAARACYALSPFQLDERLQKAAQWMANHVVTKGMRRDDFHTDLDGNKPWHRVWREGWPEDWAMAENLIANGVGLAEGKSAKLTPDFIRDNPRECIDKWLCSDNHRAALLHKKYTHVGIAYASGKLPELRSVCVVVFGEIPGTKRQTPRDATGLVCNYTCREPRV